jgi:oxygen-dependent protoporphyrinogen oxidase
VKVVVIGGGLTGLAAAHRLIERAGAPGRAIDVCVIEASDRTGGGIRTTREATPLGDLWVEWGADSFITEKPAALALAKRLGLGGRILGTRDAPNLRRALVVRGGKLHAVPKGFILLGPARLGPLLRSPILTPAGKLRVAMDFLLPPRPKAGDESLASFVRRRFGRECLDRLAQPLVGGIYTADPERLSLRATFPHFLEMERAYGSVIRGLRALERRRAAGGEGEAGARYGLFVSFDCGMQALPDALASRLGADRIRTGAQAVRVRRGRPWEVALGTGEVLGADALVIALSSARASKLLRETDEALASAVGAIPVASSAIVTLAWRREDVRHSLDAFGFVVPAAEKRRILAATFSSVKFEGRAPEGVVLLRAFVGGRLQAELAALPDEALERAARQELGELLGIRGNPLYAAVHRHAGAMPQYEVGHVERVRSIQAAAFRHPGLTLAGNWLHGVGIPDCVRSGEEAADALLRAYP